jgi:hypothetical protein
LEVELIMLLLCHSYMWPTLRPHHPHNIVNILNIQHPVQSRFYNKYISVFLNKPSAVHYYRYTYSEYPRKWFILFQKTYFY